MWLAFVMGLLLAIPLRAAGPVLEDLTDRAWEAFGRRDHRKLDTLVLECQPKNGALPLCRDGQSRLSAIFAALEKYRASTESVSLSIQATLEAWAKAAPDSGHWRIYEAAELGNLIWLEKTAGGARAKWDRAVQLFSEAEAKVGRVPDWYCCYIRLARAARLMVSRNILNEVPAIFDDWEIVTDEGVKRFPDHTDIGFIGARLVADLKRPGGQDGWARHLCELLPDRGLETYAKIWWRHEPNYRKKLFAPGNADWPTFREGFFALLKRHPESKRLVAKFLEFCRNADDAQTAKELLPKLGEKPGPDAFPVTVRFLEIRDWALGHPNVRTPLWSRHKGGGWSVAWSKDGRILYAGFTSQHVRLLDAKNSELVESLLLEDAPMSRRVHDIAVSPDGKLLAAVNGTEGTKNPGTCRIWELDTLQEKAVFRAKAGPLRSISWAPNGSRLVATGGILDGPGEAWLWQDGSDADGVNVKDAQHHSIEASAWSPDNSKLVFNGLAGRILVMEPGKQARDVKQITVPIPTWVTGMRYSPDGKWLAVCCGGGFKDKARANGGVTIFHAADMEPRKDGKPPLTGGLLTLDWSPDGKWIACAGYDGYVYVLDSTTLEMKTWWNAEQETIRKLRWSPDGEKIATATDSGGVSVWKVW